MPSLTGSNKTVYTPYSVNVSGGNSPDDLLVETADEEAYPSDEQPVPWLEHITQTLDIATSTHTVAGSVLDAVRILEGKFTALIDVLGHNVGLKSGSEDDLIDMTTIINCQNQIIQALLTHDALDDEARGILGETMAGLGEWERIEEAKERIQHRHLQRSALTDSKRKNTQK